MSYPGSKNGHGVKQTIINRMPPHRVYIEAFLGSGAIMRAKKPALINIGIDADPAVIAKAADIAGSIGVSGDVVPQFRFECGDALGILQKYPFVGDELVYLDPPYLASTRAMARPMYRHELGDDRHPFLLDIARRLPCPVMISGYWSRLYEGHLRHWHAIEYKSMTRSGQATEFLWCNFPPPVALHDYRYLGTDFRERERIKRRKESWTTRLRHMPVLERQAVLAAIEEAWRPGNDNAAPARIVKSRGARSS